MYRIIRIQIYRILEFNQSHWLKPYIKFNTKKRIEEDKNKDKNGKALYKLKNNARYETKKIENRRNRINVKLVDNKKRLFKLYIKTKLYVTR